MPTRPQVLNEVLYLQRLLTNEARRLDAALDKPELCLKGWTARGPARIMLIAGWVHHIPPHTDLYSWTARGPARIMLIAG